MTRNFFSVFIPALLSTAVSLLAWHYFSLRSDFWIYSVAWHIVLFFGINLYYTGRSKSPEFTQLLLGGIVVKLLLSLIIILIFAFIRAGFFAFALHFISHYILFTIFEIRYLLPLIRRNTPAKIKSNEE